MNPLPSSPPHAQTWPPQRGWPLFLAWMAGVVVVQIVSAVVMAAVLLKAGPLDWKARLPYTLLAIVVHAWQAWLIFQKAPGRFALWTILPAINVFLPLTMRMVGYASLLRPLWEAAILRGVRQRAWAWILAGMAGVILTQIGTWFMYGGGPGQDIARRLAGNILGPAASPSMVALVTSGIFRGLWLITESISVAVLAWKMPPVGASTLLPPATADDANKTSPPSFPNV